MRWFLETVPLLLQPTKFWVAREWVIHIWIKKALSSTKSVLETTAARYKIFLSIMTITLNYIVDIKSNMGQRYNLRHGYKV